MKKFILLTTCMMLLLATFCDVDGIFRRRRRRYSPPSPICYASSCTLSQWSYWTQCSRSCDGLRHRSRYVLTAASCGGSCDSDRSQSESCNTYCNDDDTPRKTSTKTVTVSVSISGVVGLPTFIIIIYCCCKR